MSGEWGSLGHILEVELVGLADIELNELIHCMWGCWKKTVKDDAKFLA